MKQSIVIFLIFNGNLLALKHSLIFSNSIFTLEKRVPMSLWKQNKFASSANIVEPRTKEVFGRSFTERLKNKGPSIDYSVSIFDFEQVNIC